MRSRGLIVAGVALASLLCLALPAIGQNATIHFDGSFQGDVYCGGVDGCVGTGFYGGTVNGTAFSPGMICDDYSHTITSGETWTAEGIDVANLNAGNIGQTEFGSTIGLVGYTELAWLVNDMFTSGAGNSALQSSISQAIWFITSGGASTGHQGGVLTGTALSLYTSAVAFATGGGSLSAFANLWLYTPLPNNGPQEMWGTVPVAEGGAALLYLLLAGLTCFGAMFVRRSRNQNAKVA